tara:strand:- start:444 stop:1088 length:645 start_codon:yes stop_codon:yes gene_type:complete
MRSLIEEMYKMINSLNSVMAWYVLRTKPRSDRVAFENLERNGYNVFFPEIDIPIRGEMYNRTPLFPGYLFIRLDPQKAWPLVELVPGVMGWLRSDGKIPSIGDEVIADLKQRIKCIADDGGLWTKFKPGQTVRVVSGKLEGLARVVEEPRSPESKVRVLLEIMGRYVPAQVPWHHIKVVGSKLNNNKVTNGPARRTRGRGRWIKGNGPRKLAIN